MNQLLEESDHGSNRVLSQSSSRLESILLLTPHHRIINEWVKDYWLEASSY